MKFTSFSCQYVRWPRLLKQCTSPAIRWQEREADHSASSSSEAKNKIEGKAIPVTGRGGPHGCETSRFPHFLDNRLTDCG
jgi:hypothetical protein